MCIPITDIQLDTLLADNSWWSPSTQIILEEKRRLGKPVYLHTVCHVLLLNPKPAQALLAVAEGDAEDVENMNAMLEYALPDTPRSRSRGAQYMFAWMSRQRMQHVIKNAVAVNLP